MRYNKLVILLIVIYVVITLVVFIFFKAVGDRNYWKRAIAQLHTCPFGEEQLQIMSEESLSDLAGQEGIVSYSLYGDYERYSVNLLKSLKHIPLFYPNWEPYVYVGVDIPSSIKTKLLEGGAKVITIGPDKYQGHEGALWRFLPAMQDLPFVSLDADDVFDDWIARQIQKWLDSGKQFGNFKRYGLCLKMAAGLWGSRNSAVPNMDELIKSHCEHWFGFDEAFLRTKITPLMNKAGYYQTPTWKLKELAILGVILLIVAMIVSLYWASRQHK